MEVSYDAFISYRHADKDTRAAIYVQHWLEHFHIPGQIRKFSGKKRINRIFRDTEELPLTSNIGDDIQYALNNSEFLIVICSPRTKESVWVEREINAFLTTHDISRVLTVIVEGDPYEVIPERLTWTIKEMTTKNGEKISQRVPLEPLSCDLRVGRFHASRQEMPRLAASILGVPYDTLIQRHRQYRLRVASATSGVVGLVILGFSLHVWRSNIMIQNNYDQALNNQSAYLASESEKARNSGDRMTAIRLALEALPKEGDERPVNIQAVRALLHALPAYITEDYASVNLLPDASYLLESPVTAMCLSASEDWLAVMEESGMINIWHTADGTKAGAFIPKKLTADQTAGAAFSGYSGDERLIYTAGDEVCCASLPSCDLSWSKDMIDETIVTSPVAAVLNSGSHVLVSDGGTRLTLLQADDGREVNSAALTELTGNYTQIHSGCSLQFANQIRISPDDRYAAIAVRVNSPGDDELTDWIGETAVILDLESFEFTCLPIECGRVIGSGFTEDDTLLTVCRPYGTSGTYSVFGGTIMQQSNDIISAWSPDNGSLLWEQEESSVQDCLYTAVLTAPFTNADGSTTKSAVLVYSSLACFFDQETGELLKRVETPGPILEATLFSDGTLHLITKSGFHVIIDPDPASAWTAVQTRETSLFACRLGEEQLWTVTEGYGGTAASVLEYSTIVTDENWVPLTSDEVFSYTTDQVTADNAIVLAGTNGLLISDGQPEHPLKKAEIPAEPLSWYSKELSLTTDQTKAAIVFPASPTAYLVSIADGSYETIALTDKADAVFLDVVFQNDCFYYLRAEGSLEKDSTQKKLYLGKTTISGENTELLLAEDADPALYMYSITVSPSGSDVLVFQWNWERNAYRTYLVNLEKGTADTLADPTEVLLADRTYTPGDQACFLPDGKGFALFCGDNIYLFDRKGEKTIQSGGTGVRILSMSFDPNGCLMTVSDDNCLRKYDDDLSLQWTAAISLDSAYANDYDWEYVDEHRLLLSANRTLVEVDLNSGVELISLEGFLGYQPEAGRFLCQDLSGYGFRQRYTLDTMIEKGWETLLNYEMTDLQKESYGLSDPDRGLEE